MTGRMARIKVNRHTSIAWRAIGVPGFLLMILLLAVTGPIDLARAQEGESGNPIEEEEKEAPQGPSYAYEVTFEGIADSGLQTLLEQSSQAIALKDEPPKGWSGLARRVGADVDRFASALRSEGYYAASIDHEIDRTVTPAKVLFTVDIGPVYTLADYTIEYIDPTPPAPSPDITALGLELGAAARAPSIVAAQKTLLTVLSNQGYPLAKVDDRKARVNHDTKAMSVILKVAQGPLSSIGPAVFEGLQEVESDYLVRLLPWQQGDLYRQEDIDAGRRALSGTGLFNSVKIQSAATPDSDGQLPLTITVAERPQRSIGGTLSYSTSEGPGATIFWEHRNYFGRNEKLGVTAKVAQIEQSLSLNFRKPHFLRLDQHLLANAAISRKDTDAFEEESVSAFAGLERKLSDTLTGTLGTSVEYSILKDEEGERTFLLFGAPATLARDTSDDPLHPTKGSRLRLSLTPYIGTLEENTLFLVSEASGSTYYSVFDDDKLVLAARTRLGSIAGEETEIIPANKRFYAGGGGSIRGFEFQKVGPLDDDEDPLGGRSVLELGFEARIRLTETIGLVPFIEGGTVFDSSFPDFDEELLWSAGLGLRYFTAIGPVRLDVGFPLNGRDGVDGLFEFYVSLGQAF